MAQQSDRTIDGLNFQDTSSINITEKLLINGQQGSDQFLKAKDDGDLEYTTITLADLPAGVDTTFDAGTNLNKTGTISPFTFNLDTSLTGLSNINVSTLNGSNIQKTLTITNNSVEIDTFDGSADKSINIDTRTYTAGTNINISGDDTINMDTAPTGITTINGSNIQQTLTIDLDGTSTTFDGSANKSITIDTTNYTAGTNINLSGDDNSVINMNTAPVGITTINGSNIQQTLTLKNNNVLVDTFDGSANKTIDIDTRTYLAGTNIEFGGLFGEVIDVKSAITGISTINSKAIQKTFTISVDSVATSFDGSVDKLLTIDTTTYSAGENINISGSTIKFDPSSNVDFKTANIENCLGINTNTAFSNDTVMGNNVGETRIFGDVIRIEGFNGGSLHGIDQINNLDIQKTLTISLDSVSTTFDGSVDKTITIDTTTYSGSDNISITGGNTINFFPDDDVDFEGGQILNCGGLTMASGNLTMNGTLINLGGSTFNGLGNTGTFLNTGNINLTGDLIFLASGDKITGKATDKTECSSLDLSTGNSNRIRYYDAQKIYNGNLYTRFMTTTMSVIKSGFELLFTAQSTNYEFNFGFLYSGAGSSDILYFQLYGGEYGGTQALIGNRIYFHKTDETDVAFVNGKIIATSGISVGSSYTYNIYVRNSSTSTANRLLLGGTPTSTTHYPDGFFNCRALHGETGFFTS